MEELVKVTGEIKLNFDQSVTAHLAKHCRSSFRAMSSGACQGRTCWRSGVCCVDIMLLQCLVIAIYEPFETRWPIVTIVVWTHLLRVSARNINDGHVQPWGGPSRAVQGQRFIFASDSRGVYWPHVFTLPSGVPHPPTTCRLPAIAPLPRRPPSRSLTK